MDGTYAYVMVETHNIPISPDAGIEINFNYKPWQHHTHGPHDDLGVNIGTTTLDAWNDNNLDGESEPYPITGYTVVRGNVMEARIPLSEIENAAYFNPTFVNIWTAGAPPESGDDPSSIVEAIAGEVHFERTWFPESQTIWMRLNNPETVDELRATVRVEGISSNTEWIFARIGGAYCLDENGEVYARVGIKGNDTYITVYSEYWDGDHLIDKPLLPSTSLGPVTQGNGYELTLEWNESTATFTFGVSGLDDSINYTRSYTVPGPVSPADNPYRAIGITSWIFLDTTPPFDWQAVPGANHYRVRIYGWNDNQIYQGNTKSPSYTLPPGILKPDGIYRLRIYALRDHQWFEWENVSRSVWDSSPFITGSNEAQNPYINLRSIGVYTWNHRPPFEAYTHFSVRIHDAQGVPDDIESVVVTIPGGETVNLYIDEYITANEGQYKGVYFGGTPAGQYTFIVTDKDGNNSNPVTETLNPDPVDYLDAASLTPAHNTLIGDTGVNFDWGAVAGATNYWLAIYDKNYNRLFGVHTNETDFVLPPGLLNENSLYRYQIENYREFREDNLNNGSTSPPKGVWNANMFTTTAAAGTAPPGLNLDRFGAAVWHVPHPATGVSLYSLDLMAMVTDADGVPENIERVEVVYPDGTTIKALKYDNSPDWGINYYDYEYYTDPALIQTGAYTFRVTDFGGNTIELQDILTNVTTNILPWPTNVTPADKTVVYTATPTINWDTVPGAEYYKVRIMSAYRHPTVHWSGELTDTFYTIPDGILENGATHGYKVYAYREAIATEVDFSSANRSWHQTNYHFTIRVSDTGPVIDSFSADTTSGLAPLTVEFTCQASDPGGAIVEYRWDYDGDGAIDETSTSGPVIHTYDAPGTYPALVTVEDSEGALATSNPITITVLTTGNDADGDGVPDADDNCPNDANPLQDDFDADGTGDACDNCPDDPNPDQADSDGDAAPGIGGGDVCDPDDDNDGIPDDGGPAPCDTGQKTNCDDNCPTAFNFSQADLDDDGIGDVCDPDADGDGHDSFEWDDGDDCYPMDPNFWEPQPGDPECIGAGAPGGKSGAADSGDGDNIKDNRDNCDNDYNPYPDNSWTDIYGATHGTDAQVDSDLDNQGDECDTCKYDPDNDADDDGVCDDPSGYCAANPGVCGPYDLCPGTPAGETVDSSGCSAADRGDTDGDGYTGPEDCAEGDPTIYSGAPEVCDNKDNDCDGIPDDGLTCDSYHVEFTMTSPSGETMATWLPDVIGGAGEVTIESDIYDSDGNWVKAKNRQWSFIVENQTTYAGAFTNDESTSTSNDFADPVINIRTGVLDLICNDHGGSITIKVMGMTDTDPPHPAEGRFTLPVDTDGDGLADNWEYDSFGNLSHDGSGDADNDGLANSEEFRGFRWGPKLKRIIVNAGTDQSGGVYQTTAWVPDDSDAEAKHFRGNPQRKDLFLQYKYYDVYNNFNGPSSTFHYQACPDGADVDSLPECPFSLGDAFYQAGVDTHAVSFNSKPAFMSGTSIEAWENNIDAGLIRNISSFPYGSSDGDIDKLGARDWDWDTKGWCNIGDELFYGPDCKTYQIPLDNYFAQRPYIDGGSLPSNLGSSDYLDPVDSIAAVEDANDSGYWEENQDNFITNQGVIDGDCFDFTLAEPGDSNYNSRHTSFDVDRDGKVELPVVSDPQDPATDAYNDNYPYEYTKAQVLKHTITHELGHMVGTDHTTVSDCVMNDVSNNWSRDDHFSSSALNAIRFHNN
jgi:hypothetical protein